MASEENKKKAEERKCEGKDYEEERYVVVPVVVAFFDKEVRVPSSVSEKGNPTSSKLIRKDHPPSLNNEELRKKKKPCILYRLCIFEHDRISQHNRVASKTVNPPHSGLQECLQPGNREEGILPFR